MSDDWWLCRYRESRWTPRMLWYRFGRAVGFIKPPPPYDWKRHLELDREIERIIFENANRQFLKFMQRDRN